MVDHVAHGYALEIVDLTTREDGGDDLVFLGCGENEDDIGRRFLKGLEESVESLLREHMDLIDDKHAVGALRGGHLHLLDKLADVVDAVVGSGVEFYDIERSALVERTAAVALVASLSVGCRIGAVDGLGENSGAGSLADASRTAEEVAVGQTVRGDSVLQCRGQRLLPDDAVERRRTIFSR